MGKGNAMKLAKVLKRLNLRTPTMNIWEKLSSRDECQGVRKGFLPVYVGKEAWRYEIPLSCLKHPIFLQLLKRAEEEFGFCGGSGGLRIPCDAAVFDQLLLFIRREENGLHDGEMHVSLDLFM